MKTTILLLLLVLTLSGSAFCSTTLRVPGEVLTIQEALDASSPGDTIVIAPGTYAVNLVLSTDIELRGETADSPTILESATWDQAIIRIEGGEVACSVTLANLTLEGSYGIAVFCGPDSTVALDNCAFDENEIGLFAHSNASVTISECRFLHQYQCDTKVEGTANLSVRDSYFEVHVDTVGVIGAGQAIIELIDSSFHGIDIQLYQDRGDAIQAFSPISLSVVGCEMIGLGMGMDLVALQSLIVSRSSFLDGLFGVHINSMDAKSAGATVEGCSFVRMGQPIRMMGSVGEIAIQGNEFRDTQEGPAIGVCLEVCGCTTLSPFEGSIVGSDNVIDDGRRRTCPPYRAPFWPQGFVAN